MTAAARLAIVAALAFLAWSGWTYSQAEQADGDDIGQARDLVLRTGQRQVAVLNSMTWTQSDAGLRQWQDVSTGPLRERLVREAPGSEQQIVKARTTATATVDDAALTALDVRAGSARLIATVQIRLTPPNGAPAVQRKRYEAGLARTPGGWKLTSLTAIPVSAR
ncbi:hypothetical protein [Actinomadura sp. 9N407]|uniref:hypothetical protein n=1 Tax=Actinomadura sp. 9N407 TaxID=3375154 RepID=UPI003789D615